MAGEKRIGRRQFNAGTALVAGASLLPNLSPLFTGRAPAAAPTKLKVGVLLPRSGLQAQIGQSCQKGADLAPEVIKSALGVDIELMNADTESNADTARTRAERLIEEGAMLSARSQAIEHPGAVGKPFDQAGFGQEL